MILLAPELWLSRDKRPAQKLTPVGQKVKAYRHDITGVSLRIAAYRGRSVHIRRSLHLQIIIGVDVKPFGLFLMENSDSAAERTEPAVIASGHLAEKSGEVTRRF
jgi:hypothetical protein